MSPPQRTPGRPNVAMTRVSTDNEADPAGAFYFTDIHPWADGAAIITPESGRFPGWIYFVDNRCQPLAIPIKPNVTDKGHGWEWDGNWDHPTLTPSIHTQGEYDGQKFTIWHGYIKGGIVGHEC